MKETLIAGDDEVDLGSTFTSIKRLSREGLILSGLVLVASLAVVFQQGQSNFSWQGDIVHADTTASAESGCALTQDAATFFARDNAEKSLLVPDCAALTVPKALPENDATQPTPPVEVAVSPSSTPIAPENTTIASDAETLEHDITTLVSGYPIDAMAGAIAKQDRTVAAFLVGIAKKESDWGKHVPTKSGSDCFNYWGYKGQGGRGDAMGYACFASREEAVETVGGRLFTLAKTQHRDTPTKMLAWKCGSSCAGHTAEGVASWVGTVETYYKKLL